MATLRRTPWRCEKCGENKVENDKEPLDRLMPTLMEGLMIGYCARCRHTRMFRREGS